MMANPSEVAGSSPPPLLATVWPRLEAQFLGRLYSFEGSGGEDGGGVPRIEADYSWITPDSFMSWYTQVYEYCTATRTGVPAHAIGGGELYGALVDFMRRYLPRVRTHLKGLSEAEGLLEAYLRLWRGWRMAAGRVEAVFNYLDRFWIDRERQGKGAATAGRVRHLIPLLYALWDELALQPVEADLQRLAGQALAVERSSSLSMSIEPSPAVRELFLSYQELSTLPADCLLRSLQSRPEHYANIYEQRLLPWYCKALGADNEAFWSAISAAGEDSSDTDATLLRVQKVRCYWEAELGRSSAYLGGASVAPIIWRGRVKERMRADLLAPLLGQIVKDLVVVLGSSEADPARPLKIYYQTMALRKSLLADFWPAVEAGFLARLRARLPTRMPGTARSEQLLMFISMLFAMFQEGRRVLHDAGLDGEPLATGALDAALGTFLTDPAAKASFHPVLGECLARWIDQSYRDQQPLTRLGVQFILVLLRSMEGRQSFQDSYARLLSRRLLARQAFFNREREEELLRELAAAYGSAFVASLRRMLTDVEASLSLTQQFMTRNQKRPKLPFDLAFQVLSASCWPVPPAGGPDYTDCQPTAWSRWTGQLGECIDSFSRFYWAHHAPGNRGGGRRLLRWSAALTAAEVEAVFGDRSYTLILTVPQLAIVQSCTEHHPQSLSGLAETTGFSPALLDEALGRLLRVQLIHQHGDGFYLNGAFSSPHGRINLLGGGGMLEERLGTGALGTRDSSEDRSMAMQAAIVRCLKRVRRANRKELGALTGVGDAAELDRLLGLLLDKEYLALEGDVVVFIP